LFFVLPVEGAYMSKGLPRAHKTSSKSSIKLTDRILYSLHLKRRPEEVVAKKPKGFAGKAQKEASKDAKKAPASPK
jgi:hypothetical protein